MPDGLVKQDAGPTWPQHNRHRARRRRNGLEIDQRLADRLAAELQRAITRNQLRQGETAARAGIALLAPAILLNEHRYVETHERSDVRRQLALTRGDQHHFVYGRDTRGHVNNTRIQLPGLAIDPLQPRNLV